MNASRAIELLKEVRKEHGDIDVITVDEEDEIRGVLNIGILSIIETDYKFAVLKTEKLTYEETA